MQEGLFADKGAILGPGSLGSVNFLAKISCVTQGKQLKFRYILDVLGFLKPIGIYVQVPKYLCLKYHL